MKFAKSVKQRYLVNGRGAVGHNELLLVLLVLPNLGEGGNTGSINYRQTVLPAPPRPDRTRELFSPVLFEL